MRLRLTTATRPWWPAFSSQPRVTGRQKSSNAPAAAVAHHRWDGSILNRSISCSSTTMQQKAPIFLHAEPAPRMNDSQMQPAARSQAERAESEAVLLGRRPVGADREPRAGPRPRGLSVVCAANARLVARRPPACSAALRERAPSAAPGERGRDGSPRRGRTDAGGGAQLILSGRSPASRS
jgi:hypothetical protein